MPSRALLPLPGRSLAPAAGLHRSRAAGRPVPAPRAGRARPSRARSRRERRVIRCAAARFGQVRDLVCLCPRCSGTSASAPHPPRRGCHRRIPRMRVLIGRATPRRSVLSGWPHRSEAAASCAHVQFCRVPRRRWSGSGRASSTGQGARSEQLRCKPPRRAARPGPTVRRGTRRTQDAPDAPPPIPLHHARDTTRLRRRADCARRRSRRSSESR